MPVPQFLQDEGIFTQECQNLISSLPTERGWLETHLHQHQAFWYPTKVLQALVWCQANFKPQDSDILLVTTPKAGTTWIKALAFALVNRARFPDPTQHPLLRHNPHALVPFLELKLYVDNPDPDLSALPSPRLFATHVPLVSLPHSVEQSVCKIVYLCRNPKDTFVSLWHYTNSLRTEEMGPNPMEEMFDMFCRGVSPFGPYWDHVLSYWKASLENPEKMLFMKFEDIKQQPKEEIRKLASFLGCPFSHEEERADMADQILNLCSFDNLSKQEVNKSGTLPTGEPNKVYFRRGEVEDWKNYLTAEMIQILNKITEENFLGSGLAF